MMSLLRLDLKTDRLNCCKGINLLTLVPAGKHHLLAIILVLFASSPAFAQNPHQEYADQVYRTQNQRLRQLSKLNQAANRRLSEKVLRSLRRRQFEIYQLSDGLFGDTREWTAGIYTVTGKLADVDKGNVHILTASGPVNEQIKEFCEKDQEHLELFRSWDKLGTEKKKQWLKDYYAKQEQEALQSGFDHLRRGFDRIVVGETRLADVRRILGYRMQPLPDDPDTLRWYSKHPDTGELVTLTVKTRDEIAQRVILDGFD